MKIFGYMCAPDGAYPWRQDGTRKVDLGYYRQLASAYDQLGYTGALFATGAHDVWALGGALASFTDRLKFLIAIHPGLIPPTLLGKMAASLQEFTKGRVLLNIVSGTTEMLETYGLHLPHGERYAMADEYLSIWHRLMEGEAVTYEGRYISLKNAKLALPIGKTIPAPPLYFGGSSDAAIDVAARHVHTYLSWGETPDQLAEKHARVQERAKSYGRELSFGVRLYVIVRRTNNEAWDAANDLYAHMDADSVAANQRMINNTDSVGQKRMAALHQGKKPENLRDLEIAPNLWSGIGLVRPGPGTAIVGSPDTVLRTLEAYRKAGIETFILSGMPLLEEAYRFGELVMPRLPTENATSTPINQNLTWSTLFDRDQHSP